MGYHFVDHTADVSVQLDGHTLDALFASAAQAFTEVITPLGGVEPRRPEELDIAAPELDLLLVDLLSELLYRFDTRGWLTREAAIEIREVDEGWVLQGTLVGESHDPERHPVLVLIKAVTFHALAVARTDGEWRATVVFDV